MEGARLNIGIACFPLIGGSGILATALGSELAARGHQVHFFSYAQPVRLDLSMQGIHFHRVDVAHHSLFPCPDYTLPLAVRLAEVARDSGLDVFHMHYAVPHALAACLADQMLGDSAPRIVTTLHGTDTTLLGENPAYRPAIEHALSHSDAVTAVSQSLKERTLKLFPLKREIDVIGNFFVARPASRTREDVRGSLGLTNEYLLLHMSNVRPLKRIDLLLRAMALVRSPSVRLLILAGGPMQPYAALLNELNLQQRVVIRENTAAVEQYLAAADAGIYTSEYESFGLGILETMFSAKPVVAFRVGGIPEVVGDTCPLYEFPDVHAMASGIDSLIDTPEFHQECGRSARARAEEHFTAERIVPLYEELYRRVLG
jgi:N-acetyl-alpha-D-glucosaminyl L-malate synthase BshA